MFCHRRTHSATHHVLFATTVVAALLLRSDAKVIDYEADGGAKAGDHSWDTVWKNGAALNTTLAMLQPGDTLLVPEKKFYIMGGVQVAGLNSVTIQIDGTLEFASTTLDAEKYMDKWPGDEGGSPHACLTFTGAHNITFTSTKQYGLLDGAGGKWWGLPGIGYIHRKEHRPRMLHIKDSTDLLVEKLFFKDSPYWTFLADNVKKLEVRYSKIDNRRENDDGHSIVDLTAFNTDGFDLGGCDDVWIHDSTVWNQDDCFDVKDGTSNVLIERVNASGLGLTIGSIASTVRNITFRDAYMHHTYKGIYMKFRGAGHISDVLYENIVIDEPEQFAIWVGPAQQCDGCGLSNVCSTDGGPCSICWPDVPGTKCGAPANAYYTNVTLRNITVNNPKIAAGVLLANETSPMVNLVLENVVVNNPAKTKTFGDDQYYCKNVNGKAIGTTSPVPKCLHDETIASQTTAEQTTNRAGRFLRGGALSAGMGLYLPPARARRSERDGALHMLRER